MAVHNTSRVIFRTAYGIVISQKRVSIATGCPQQDFVMHHLAALSTSKHTGKHQACIKTVRGINRTPCWLTKSPKQPVCRNRRNENSTVQNGWRSTRQNPLLNPPVEPSRACATFVGNRPVLIPTSVFWKRCWARQTLSPRQCLTSADKRL